MLKRDPDPELWNKVQTLAQNDDGKIEAVNIIFKQQYELPEENIELLKKLAKSDQPKNVRLLIAKNLEECEYIPFGMYIDLFEILSNDPDIEVKKLLDTARVEFKKFIELSNRIQPSILATRLDTLVKHQQMIKNFLDPLNKLQSLTLRQFDALNISDILKKINTLQTMFNSINLNQIKIPTKQFNINDILPRVVKTKGIPVGAIFDQAAENEPILKEVIESNQKLDENEKKINEIYKIIVELVNGMGTLKDSVSNNFKDIRENQNSITNLINRKLSPFQTIVIALCVGIAASFLGSFFFSLLT